MNNGSASKVERVAVPSLGRFVRTAFACALIVGGTAATAQPHNPYALSRLMRKYPEPRTNVLFLIADDLNCDLGCYGAEVRTPNIDRLAARGVRFERAYCQIPLCSPSRTSMLTGLRPDATGIRVNPPPGNPYAAHFRMNVPHAVTLPQLFKQEGWFAARVGKIYHFGVPYDIGSSGLDDLASWDLAINPRGRDREMHDRIYAPGAERRDRTLGDAESGFTWLADEEGTDEEHTDGIAATEAIRLLERFKKEARPFFLAVGFHRPHTPLVAPRNFFAAHAADRIELAKLSDDDKSRTPAPAYSTWRAAQSAAPEAQRRGAIQAYRATIAYMDAQVGRILETVDRLGLAGNTVIVFTSDHGYHLGDHDLWQKMSLFERSARVPLIIAEPTFGPKGQATRSIAELVDLYPTLAGICGIPIDQKLDGTSLQPVLRNPTTTVKKAAFSQIQTRDSNADGYAVRTDRWRYIEWDGGARGKQLFDLERDPQEATNLAADPRFAADVAELHALLQSYRQTMRPPQKEGRPARS